jgi:hypothetical protein
VILEFKYLIKLASSLTPCSSEQLKDLASSITIFQQHLFVDLLQFLLLTINPGEGYKEGGEKSSPFFYLTVMS